MVAIELENVVWLAVVTVLSCLQLVRFAEAVGNSRKKFKIDPPATDGDPEFVRTFRAQQNVLEFYTLFLVIMWIAGIFFHQIPAALAGLGYIRGRDNYFKGYCKDAKQRVPGFHRAVLMLKLLLGMSVLGLAQAMALTYLNFNIKAKLLSTIF